ncbi:hypothetical protein DFH07DRAFT_968683 [Mycena maculata]|uniref:Uncharacterized protein n=1 Tax=Mycena maculata TaxID=230809 RepID=A0AAD7HZL7_9AGAR|nr:hypothetical protein DFH07DRAFT_968683 [Mycena maculata]
MCRNHFPPYYLIPGVNAPEADDENEEEVTVLLLGQHGSGPVARTIRTELPAETRNQGDSEDVRIEKDTNTLPAPTTVEEQEQEHPQPQTETPDSDEGQGGADSRVHFSEAQKIHLKRCFDTSMEVMDDPRGVHPKMARVLEKTWASVEKVGGDIHRDKRRRTNPHTWADNNENTMFLD